MVERTRDERAAAGKLVVWCGEEGEEEEEGGVVFRSRTSRKSELMKDEVVGDKLRRG